MKLTEKKRNGAKVTKKYDLPQTPFARLIGYHVLTDKQQEQLQAYYRRLNPAELMRRIEEQEAGLRHVTAQTDEKERPSLKHKPKLPRNLFGKIPK